MNDSLLNDEQDLDNLNYYDMPEWMNSNSYILTGYRPFERSKCYYCKSFFKLHNETINIWTHMIGMFLFAGLLGYINTDSNLALYTGQAILMNVYVISCILTYGFSAIMHTFYPISEFVCSSLQTLDYLGIGLQIFTTMQVFIYYSFYCQPTLSLIYMNLTGALNIISLIILTNKKFTSNEYKKVKVLCFVMQVGVFLIPLIHRLILYNNDSYDKVIKGEMGYFLAAFVCFIMCIVFYLGLIPERFYRQTFDIFGSSHQIFHILSVSGSVLMFLGLKLIMDGDSRLSCTS